MKKIILIVLMFSLVGCGSLDRRRKGFVTQTEDRNMECVLKFYNEHISGKTSAEICKEVFKHRYDALEGLDVEQLNDMDY